MQTIRLSRRIESSLCVVALLGSSISARAFSNRRIAGVYLTRDREVLQSLAQRASGTYWIDGYQMLVSPQTQICWHQSPLRCGSILGSYAQPIPDIDPKSPCEPAPAGGKRRAAWLQYKAIQKSDDYFKPEMKVAATRIDVWGSGNAGTPLTQPATSPPVWTDICESPVPHELRYANEEPIPVVCDAAANKYVEAVLAALLKPEALIPDAPTTSWPMPTIYIVKPFRVRHNFDFETIDGSLGETVIATYGYPIYEMPHSRSTVHEVVYAPDGSVLIPDVVLAHLRNDAQLAALLSYSLAIFDQDAIAHLFSVQRFKPKLWSFNMRTNGSSNMKGTGMFVWNLNEQVLRLGIRRMNAAGYDIRYAPYAWAVARGKPPRWPVDKPQGSMPWYATYAFNAITQLYSTVDYSKLKRGEAEYQQFLAHLREADPAAFTAKP